MAKAAFQTLHVAPEAKAISQPRYRQLGFGSIGRLQQRGFFILAFFEIIIVKRFRGRSWFATTLHHGDIDVRWREKRKRPTGAKR
jgi:hypothetical protein